MFYDGYAFTFCHAVSDLVVFNRQGDFTYVMKQYSPPRAIQAGSSHVG
jgi:hypothetical protein